MDRRRLTRTAQCRLPRRFPFPFPAPPIGAREAETGKTPKSVVSEGVAGFVAFDAPRCDEFLERVAQGRSAHATSIAQGVECHRRRFSERARCLCDR